MTMHAGRNAGSDSFCFADAVLSNQLWQFDR
jgi:hypothetical protein